jgi:CubicO group peptidase (beta-lactamase class C family)
VARLCIELAAIALCVGATTNSPAQEQIEHAVSPAAAAARSEAFAQLPALLAERYPTIRSLVLARRDCVEFEYYAAGLNAQSQSPVRSIAKSVISILVGIARDQGYLRLDERLSEILPEVLDPTVDLPVRDITIRDLLTMTSGFGLPQIVTRRGVAPPEVWRWTLRRPMLHPPGDRFHYDGDSANLLSVVLTRAIGQNSRTFAEKNLFRPLQIANVDWTADDDGYLIGESGLSLTARDMAKLGLLYLQRGRWDDRQIVSSDYVDDSTTKHNDGGLPTGAAYGYLWWVTQTKTGLDAFFAAGIGSQLIYVVPGLDLIVAVASSRIAGGSVRFVNDVVLPTASNAFAPSTCIAHLER